MAKPGKTSAKTVDVADSYAVRLTGVAASEVIGTNKHWQAFYEARRPCLADPGAGRRAGS